MRNCCHKNTLTVKVTERHNKGCTVRTRARGEVTYICASCTGENVWLWSIGGLDTPEPSRGAGWTRLLLFLALFPCALNTRMWFRDGFLNWASPAHKDLPRCLRGTVKFVHRIDIESRGDIFLTEKSQQKKKKNPWKNKKRDTRYKNKRSNSAVLGIYNCLIV